MDYKEEQQQEIEILESIYPDELEVEDETHFSITLALETPSERKHVAVLSVEYPENYPEEVPLLGVEFGEVERDDDEDADYDDDSDDETDKSTRPVVIPEIVEFDDEDVEEFVQKLQDEATEQLGMPSVFSLTSSLKEMAEQRFEEKVETAQKKHDEELLAKEREEQKKFYGTKVTQESFAQWRIKFRKDMGIDERIEKRQKLYHGGKMTGKEIFEKGLAGDDDIEELTVDVAAITTTDA